MVANAVQTKTETPDGCDVFINFIHAVKAAKKGNERLIILFATLKVDLNLDTLAIYGLILSRAPLSVEQALALKEIIEFRGK